MENIYDDVSVTTEDNTKVFRIMNDFQDFLKGQSTDKSLPRNSSLKLQVNFYLKLKFGLNQ